MYFFVVSIKWGKFIIDWVNNNFIVKFVLYVYIFWLS